MAGRTWRRTAWAALAIACWVAPAPAQTSEDDTINTIRELGAISGADQRRINDWVLAQVGQLTESARKDANAAFVQFRDRFQKQYAHAKNSQAFRAQLAAQTAQVAADWLSKRDLQPTVGWALVAAISAMEEPEVLPALISGLKSTIETVRFLSAKSLAGQKLRDAIANDAGKFAEVMGALQAAGVVESSSVVLSRIYEGLAYPTKASTVLPAYQAIFDARLSARRRPMTASDGAEFWAYEFFRTPAVMNSLTAEQKNQLVQRLATFLRADAERYNAPNLQPNANHNEIVSLELSLDAVEEVLTTLAGAGKGGKIREQLARGGIAQKAEVLKEAYKWVGDPQSKEPGALNAAPWDVPLGAP